MTETALDVVERARSNVLLGDRALASGDFAAAKAAYADALIHLPNHSELLVRYGEACLRLGQGIPAERSFSVIVSTPSQGVHPGVFQAAFYGLIKAYVLNGRHDRVAQMLLKNVGAIQHDRPFMDSLALSLTNTGDLRRLLDFADEIAGGKPLPGQAGLAAVGMIQAGHASRGLKILTAKTEADPADTDTIALYWRGVALSRSEAGLSGVLDEPEHPPTQAAVFKHYQLARYVDVTDHLDRFDGKPEFALHADVRRAVPVASGRSQMKLPPVAEEALETPRIDPDRLARSMASLRETVLDLRADGAFKTQLDNVAAIRKRYAPDAADPVQVVSTGRCGTRALYYLLRKSESVLPYHSAQFSVVPVDRNHMLYRLLTGRLDQDAVAPLLQLYLQIRTAELMYAYRQNRTPVIIAHWDSVFAPFVSALFDDSRFICLRRDDSKVFRSMFGKNQWQYAQLMPLLFAPEFPEDRFICAIKDSLSIEQRVAWYLHVTRIFAGALADQLEADRFLAVRSEALFRADLTKWKNISRMCGVSDIGDRVFQDHSSGETNKKGELLQVETAELDERAAKIPALLKQLEVSGEYET